jgi:hypothetical protein
LAAACLPIHALHRGVEKLTALTGLLELNLWNNPVLSDCIIDAVEEEEDEEDEDALHLRAKAEVSHSQLNSQPARQPLTGSQSVSQSIRQSVGRSVGRSVG